ncbi:MAG: GNAT family N-acetyltransferase [Gemmatimonadaceae bacterium]|jgi:GNAT superfamily N-acetyltransferase
MSPELSTVSPRLRRAVLADAAALATLAADTFTETFGADNRPEDLAAHLAASYGIAQQTAELQDPAVITLVAEQDGALVGFAQIRRQDAPASVTAAAAEQAASTTHAATTHAATHVDPRPVELHRLYLRRVAHGTGLGAALMQGAREAAVALGGTHLWLGVWERNPRAIAFYTKSGFVRVGSHDFFVGDDRQTDWLLMTPLPSAGHLANA